jgi:hypothetical protein
MTVIIAKLVTSHAADGEAGSRPELSLPFKPDIKDPK